MSPLRSLWNPLRWAQPQNLRSPWHVVVEDIPADAEWPFGRQRAACGVLFVQQDEYADGLTPRQWLRDYACPRCAAKHPIPLEGDGQTPEEWRRWGRPAPLFPKVEP